MVLDPANPGEGPGEGTLEAMPGLIILYDPQEIIDALENNRTVILTGDIFHPTFGSTFEIVKYSIPCLGFSETRSNYYHEFKLYGSISIPGFTYNNKMCNYFISV